MRVLLRIIAPRWYARWARTRSIAHNPVGHLAPAPVRRARSRLHTVRHPRQTARRRVEDEVVRQVRRRLR